MSRILGPARKRTIAVTLVTLGALMALTGGAYGAAGRQTYTLTFVSTTPADPADLTHPYPTASFKVKRPVQKRTNIYNFVRVVTSCSDTGVTLFGNSAWVGTDGVEVSISGIYQGSTCSAWVYDTGGKNVNPDSPDSNVVSFSG